MILTLCRHLTYRRMQDEDGILTESSGFILRKHFGYVDGIGSAEGLG